VAADEELKGSGPAFQVVAEELFIAGRTHGPHCIHTLVDGGWFEGYGR